MKIAMIVLKLLFVGALVIVSNYNLHLLDSNERTQFFELYTGWADSLFRQGFEITSYVVKFEWLPQQPQLNEPAGLIFPVLGR